MSSKKKQKQEDKPEVKSGKPKAQELGLNGPGVEPIVIAEIDDAAGEYVGVRDQRMRLTKEETEARTQLLGAMRKHKLTEYRFDDRLVQVKEGETKLSVRKIAGEENGESEDAD